MKTSTMSTFITGAVLIVIGLVLLPIIASFQHSVVYHMDLTKHGGNWTATEDVQNISGLASLTNLVVYGFCFALVGLGVSLIYVAYKRR